MLQSLEATIDRSGDVRLRERIALPFPQRAIVVILPNEIDPIAEEDKPEAAKIEVHFLHHRYATIFTALISAECTGQEALNGLLRGDKTGPFLENPPAGRPYELVIANTQQVLEPTMTLAEAGVAQDDTIEVRQGGQGAGLGYSEVAQLIMTSGLSLALLRSVTSVIAQLIQSRAKTFEYESNGKKYKLTANSSVHQMIEVLKVLKEEDGLSEEPGKSSGFLAAADEQVSPLRKKRAQSNTPSELTATKKTIQKRRNSGKPASKK